MTLQIILAFVIAFLVASAFGAWLVPFLRKIKAGQFIREDGPTWHNNKAGTPAMGGLMFILAAIIVCLTVGFKNMLDGDYTHIIVLVFALVFGAIGFLDDYEKLRKKQNMGLTAKQKFLLQLVVAIAFIYLLRLCGIIEGSASKPHCIDLYIPFFNVTFAIHEIIYVIFAAFVIVGCVNAVNITDGVDGLSSGSSSPVFVFYTALCFYWGKEYLGLGIFAAAITGGLFGFLIYNFNPAKIFMGDTGSLFLGGAVAACAFAYDMPLILVTLGIVYIIETLSDIIQIVYFKATHGKRFFKMAPFHHHLEMGGWTGKKWKERELFVLFTGVSLVFAIISFLGVSARF